VKKEPLDREDLEFGYFKFHQTMSSRGPFHSLTAIHKGRSVGNLRWASEGEPEIYDINVDKGQQRRGIATHLLTKANELSRGNTSLVKGDYRQIRGNPDSSWDNPKKYDIPAPIHSPHRTEEGDAWAKSTGQKVPPLSQGQFWEHL
jgi:hypothetical protein